MTKSTLLATAASLAVTALAAGAHAQSWTTLSKAPVSGVSFLLTDGTVMVHDETGNYTTSVWYRLTPDSTGSYVNGTWTQAASLPKGYAPLDFGGTILPDGRLIIDGGEYNGSAGEDWINKSAIFNPATNAWTAVKPPKGWKNIGDAPSVMLADGTYLLGDAVNSDEALLNLSTLAWTTTGTGKADSNNEEGFTLMPNGQVLAVDVDDSVGTGTQKAEVYANGKWTAIADAPAMLANSGYELGPQIVLPSGNVLCVGGTSNTALYNPGTGKWTAGPTLPGTLDVADGPAAVLPNGDVLIGTSPGTYGDGVEIYRYSMANATLTEAANITGASNLSSWQLHMLQLPTGQILMSTGSAMLIWTDNTTAPSSWAPTITSVPSTLAPGSTYALTGTQLNGVSSGAAYGDDYNPSTNYPLVRLTNVASGAVSYARTSGFTTYAIQNKSSSTISFTVPAGIATGSTKVEVVATGIASAAVTVDVK